MQGIENLGSTCAINSLIQVISRNDILRNIILTNEFADNTISSQLKEIIDLMVVKNNSIIPHKFLNTLYSIFKDIFYKGEQIDIGELWTYLSDKIAEDIAPLPLPNKNNDSQPSLMLKDYLTDGIVYNSDAEFTNAIVNCKLLKKNMNITITSLIARYLFGKKILKGFI